MLIFLIGWLLVRFLTKLISYTVNQFEAPEPFNGISGAIIGVIVNYVGIFYILFFLSLIPYDIVQEQLSDNSVAKTMLTSTPKLTDSNYQRFIVEAYDDVQNNRSPITIEPFMDEEIEENEE